MAAVPTPENLWRTAQDLDRRGFPGLLVSGGQRCERPPALGNVSPGHRTDRPGNRPDRHGSCGISGRPPLLGHSKRAGVRQAPGGRHGRRRHGPAGVSPGSRGRLRSGKPLDALAAAAGLDIAPHIVAGLNFGRIAGEYQALERLKSYPVRRLIAVVVNPLKGTGLEGFRPPSPDEVARLLAAARECLPNARHHLGCARPHGRHRQELERLAVRAGGERPGRAGTSGQG